MPRDAPPSFSPLHTRSLRGPPAQTEAARTEQLALFAGVSACAQCVVDGVWGRQVAFFVPPLGESALLNALCTQLLGPPFPLRPTRARPMRPQKGDTLLLNLGFADRADGWSHALSSH